MSKQAEEFLKSKPRITFGMLCSEITEYLQEYSDIQNAELKARVKALTEALEDSVIQLKSWYDRNDHDESQINLLERSIKSLNESKIALSSTQESEESEAVKYLIITT